MGDPRYTNNKVIAARVFNNQLNRNGFDAEAVDSHGTHVAGTVGGSTYGVAKGATLVAVRVLDCGGSGSVSNVVAGVNWVAADASVPVSVRVCMRVWVCGCGCAGHIVPGVPLTSLSGWGKTR